MHPFEVIMIIGTTALVLVTALFLVVRNMPSRPGIEWWLSCSLILSVSYVLALLFHGEEQTTMGDIIFYTLQLSATFAVSTGTLLFITQSVNKRLAFGFFLMTALSVCGLYLNDSMFLADLLFAVYNSANMLIIAYCLIKAHKTSKGAGATGSICLLIGLHWLDYPFLKTVEWFEPIGFLIAMILGMCLSISLATLALLQFEKQTKESEQKAILASIKDPLTGLYNRSYLGRLFSEYQYEADKKERAFVLLYLDLDGFKAVNDTHGHKAGDFLLKVIAKRMTNWLHDKGDAVRIGGDELVVLTRLRAKCRSDNVYVLARRLLDTIEKPIVDGDKTYHVSASIGVCCYPLHGNKLDKLLNTSDQLMYTAKQNGGKQIKFADFSKGSAKSQPALVTA